MTDVRIVSKADLRETVADWLLKSDGSLDQSEELANLAKVALMTDRLAAEGTILPDLDDDDRRGWWGDYQASEIWDGWQIGCEEWVLLRSKIVDRNAREGSTLVRAEQYARQALRPLIDQKIASYINVKAERIGKERIDLSVWIYRGPKNEIALRFQDLWNGVKEGPE